MVFQKLVELALMNNFVCKQKEVPIVFANGQLKPVLDREVANRQKKWPLPGTAQGNAIYIPDKYGHWFY